MRLTRQILLSACLGYSFFAQESLAQSIIDPSDTVFEYNSAHPPTPPDYFHPLVKWVRTLNIENGAVQTRNPGWNSDVCKAYTYNGLCFRVQFPKTYNPGANDGKKFPLIIFLHGQGENDQTYLGPPPPGAGTYNYDNEYHLLQGPPQFDAAIQNGKYDGYVLSPQLQNNVSGSPTVYYYGILNDIMNIVKYMIANNKVDPFHIVVNGLSMGGVGTWDMLNSFPTYFAAIAPMSSPTTFVDWNNTGTYFSSKRFTPIWASQGGQDTHPTPAETQRIADTMAKYGGNFRESLYPTDGHSTWYDLWGEPDFWPFINNAYSSNPWMIGGLKTYASGQTINETIGLMAGFTAYQWRLNGAVISGATANILKVTSPGIYDARVQRDGVWSDWSHVPLTIGSGSGTPTGTTASSTGYTRIEAENYINSYGVQKENTTDVGGGQDVGYIDTDNWMDYNVSVASAGTYAINLRVSCPNGGQLQIRNSSGTVLAKVSVPVTGGWQNWQTVSTNIALTAVTQTIRIYSATTGWNFNWWEIANSSTSTNTAPPPPPPSSGTIHIEAENYVNMNGVQTENTTDVGGGQNVGYIDTGDWMDYNLNVALAGTYQVNLRVASPNGGQLQIRNSAGAILATVNVPATGAWQNWQTVTSSITLPAGTQTLRIYASSNGWNINWWEIGASGTTTTSTDTTTNTSSATTRIEAENYSAMSGIQAENTQDVGGGQDVGWIEAGDWMDYSLNVSSAGSYTLNLRVASPSGGQLQIRNSSGSVLATVNIPATGAYQTWQTISSSVSLAAGSQTIRVYASSSGWNLNWMELSGAGGSTANSSTGGTTHIESENYANMNGVAKESTTDAGGGQDVGYIDSGDWMDYNVNVSASGTYAVNLRVASPNGGQLQVKNSNGTVLATVNVPATGGWQNWQTVSANISLSGGGQTLRVYSASTGWNFNWWEISGGSGTVSAASVSKAEVVSSTALSTTAPLNIYPNPITDKFQLQINNDLTGSVSVQVYDMQGSLQKQFALSKPDVGTSQFYLSIGQLPVATYVIKVTMNGWTESKKVIKK
jgi:predicted esterase